MRCKAFFRLCLTQSHLVSRLPPFFPPAAPGMSKRSLAAMPEAVGNKKRFTAVAQNRFASDARAMEAHQQAALQEEGIKDVVNKPRR